MSSASKDSTAGSAGVTVSGSVNSRGAVTAGDGFLRAFLAPPFATAGAPLRAL
ncbi:hypothetical protein [Streptomyces montanus]|uniref:hypothetical protein n=1 Tax=Streptomyces montanus TaxID=2580423 RepID=UPI003CCC4B1B